MGKICAACSVEIKVYTLEARNFFIRMSGIHVDFHVSLLAILWLNFGTITAHELGPCCRKNIASVYFDPEIEMAA